MKLAYLDSCVWITLIEEYRTINRKIGRGSCPRISHGAAALPVRSAATADRSRQAPGQDQFAAPRRLSHLEP
jgi:hypothetical protein